MSLIYIQEVLLVFVSTAEHGKDTSQVCRREF